MDCIEKFFGLACFKDSADSQLGKCWMFQINLHIAMAHHLIDGLAEVGAGKYQQTITPAYFALHIGGWILD